MIKIEKNKNNQRFCSLCGSEPAENQLTYSSNNRRSVIPICNECLSQLQKKRTNKKIKNKVSIFLDGSELPDIPEGDKNDRY